MSEPAFERVRALARALPGVKESTAYGTPALKVRGALIARLHPDGKALVVRTAPFEREVLVAGDRKTFFVVEPHANHPWVRVELARVKPAQLKALLATACALVSPNRKVRRAR